MTEEGGTPRRTRLYGAIDPPTVNDTEPRASAPEPHVGDRIARYQIEELLGRGGMGEVLSARDDEIGRRVAIKRLRVADPSAALVARFLREARIQGRLEHPAVVPVHELWHGADGQPFFVMKQLSGTTLSEVIPRLAANDPEMAERFARQRLLNAFADVCLAIEFAHTRGVVHRDLKPANIVLGEFGEVYVLDWGVARVAGADDADRASFSDIASFDGTETVAGAILGTPGYISPEQVRGDLDIDARTDVYALGCILFELLALSPLHPRGQAALGSALGGVDARPSVRAPDRDIPPELDDLCVRATMVDREQRLATARQVGEAVQRYLDGNRDVALRRRLATDELAIARAALGTGDGPHQRRDAMRAAARALALDPTSREPADLVGALMLQIPAETPPEVEHELYQMDIHSLHTSTRFAMLAAIAYLGFFPLLYWIGFRELWYLVAGPSICAVILFSQLVVAPRNIFASGYIAIAGNVAMFALFATMVSPAILGPGPPIIMITLLVAHRRLIHPWLLAALTVVGVMSPWIWQLVNGELPISVSGTAIVIHTAATQLDTLATVVGLGIYIVSLAVLATMLSLSQYDEQHEVRRVLQLQSWQLRQLVPRD
jgi:serine/threonine-protein kinase